MAWIAIVPPSLRHPRERYQVRYQDGPHQRSSGIYPTLRRAEAERGTIERNGRDPLPVPTEPDPAKAQTLLGEYVATKWWPPWKDQHPSSGYGTRKKVEKRILPPFGNIPLAELDPSTIGTWKAAMAAERLTPRTVNTYLSLLRTILNAAVDDDYLARSPLLGKSGAGRTAATRNQPVSRREVWLVREQLDRLAEAIDPRYPALILVAALTGMRWASWSPCAGPTPASTNLWTTARYAGQAAADARAIRDPRRIGRRLEKGPKTEAGKRVIVLDQETVQAPLAHRELVGGGPYDRIFTSPGGSRGPSGTLAHDNFAHMWKRALTKAELAHLWPECGGFHFQDLRHTHATWLIAQRVPMIAVAGRLGHANAVVTIEPRVGQPSSRRTVLTDSLTANGGISPQCSGRTNAGQMPCIAAGHRAAVDNRGQRPGWYVDFETQSRTRLARSHHVPTSAHPALCRSSPASSGSPGIKVGVGGGRLPAVLEPPARRYPGRRRRGDHRAGRVPLPSRVAQPDAQQLFDRLICHPDRYPGALVFLSDLTAEHASKGVSWPQVGIDHEVVTDELVALHRRGEVRALRLAQLSELAVTLLASGPRSRIYVAPPVGGPPELLDPAIFHVRREELRSMIRTDLEHAFARDLYS